MKRYKKELDGKLEVGMVLYTKSFVLRLDRNLCKGCELCRLVCPHYAISLVRQEDADGKAVAPIVDINENKCDFHGICAAVCPFSAISITVNGQEGYPTVVKDAFPTLSRDIEVQNEKCKPGCKTCEEVCPLGIIKVSAGSDNGTPTVVNVEKELCAGCQICWMECPEDAISVTKFIEGAIKIDPDKCPEGCRRCLDVCPVDALETGCDGKILVKDMNCIYCGACKIVCPNKEALIIERTAIRHSPIKSGAWNKGLEKLTSTAALMRELGAERVTKVRTAVENLGGTGKDDKDDQ